MTLAAAKQLQTSLEAAGATVYLTHETDDYISLDDICSFSEKKAADLLSAYMLIRLNRLMKQLVPPLIIITIETNV